MARETYNTSLLQAGQAFMPVTKLAAIGAYVVGNPVKFLGTPVSTPDTGNTGNGTVTLLTADKDALVGSWTLDLTAALVCDVIDPNGIVVAKDVALTDGDATIITVDGMSLTVTDGATPFVDGDHFDIVVDGSGAFSYNIISPECIVNEERTLIAEGNLSVLTGISEIFETGVVDASGDAISLTDAAKLSLFKNGIILR